MIRYQYMLISGQVDQGRVWITEQINMVSDHRILSRFDSSWDFEYGLVWIGFYCPRNSGGCGTVGRFWVFFYKNINLWFFLFIIVLSK